MARKTRRSQKKQQRELRKRTKRKQKSERRQAQAQRAAPKSPTRVLRRARDMDIIGTWAQNEWHSQGKAIITIARARSQFMVVCATYLVDYLCLGVKESNHSSGVWTDAFEQEWIPRTYTDAPPVQLSVELAHELVWGSVEYASSIGFRPHRSFTQSQRILDPQDAHPRSGIRFGYRGRPVYVPGPEDNQIAVVSRLIDMAGLGNFEYVDMGDAPDEVRELLQLEDEPAAVEDAPPLWTPGAESLPGSVDSASGLWTPGVADTGDADTPPALALWTPARS